MQSDLAISVRLASIEDAVAVTELVNRAYAVEDFFVTGDRTNVAEIRELIERGSFIVLGHSAGLAAAVYFERSGYFGMLSVDPDFQNHGLGTRLVRIVEALSEAAGCHSVTLRVVNLREGLCRWYRSLGYTEHATSPYEHRPVKQVCHFVEMRKILRPVTALSAVAA